MNAGSNYSKDALISPFLLSILTLHPLFALQSSLNHRDSDIVEFFILQYFVYSKEAHAYLCTNSCTSQHFSLSNVIFLLLALYLKLLLITY